MRIAQSIPTLDELLPPGALYIVLELDAEISVIPGIRKSSIDLGAGIDEASRLREGNDRVHCIIFCHKFLFLPPECGKQPTFTDG